MIRSIVSRYWSEAFRREEAMQEIWTHAFGRREALDPARLDEFAPWLTALARNRCIDLLRKESRSIGPGHDDQTRVLETIKTFPDQERSAETAELREAVEVFRAKLKQQWRRFFDLHFLQGLGYAEVSARLSTSQTRCKYMKRMLVRRARRDARLLAALGRHVSPGGDNAR